MKAKQFYCRKLLSWGTFEGHYGLGLILWALITRITLAVGLWILSKVQLLIPSRPGDGLPRVRGWSQDACATMPGLNWNGNIWCPVRQRWLFRGHFGRKCISLLQFFLRGVSGCCELTLLSAVWACCNPISGHYWNALDFSTKQDTHIFIGISWEHMVQREKWLQGIL